MFRKIASSIRTSCSSMLKRQIHSFGTSALVIDVDGVIVKGDGYLIPRVKEAIEILDSTRVPYIFLTNSEEDSNDKAKSLNRLLGSRKISADNILTTYSPLRLLSDQFQNSRTLACGQGPYLEIAKSFGFSNLCTIDDVLDIFHEIDTVCWDKRNVMEKQSIEKRISDFEPIKCILLMGVTVRWESTLQLLMDVLMGQGVPFQEPRDNVPPVPIIACGVDKLWQCSAPTPRLGHGVFIDFLKEVYKFQTGHTLNICHKLGKPSYLSYELVKHRLSEMCGQLPSKILFIGDNPAVDIVGANRWKRVVRDETFVQTALVKTGVFTHSIAHLDGEARPDFIVDDFFDAVVRFLEL